MSHQSEGNRVMKSLYFLNFFLNFTNLYFLVHGLKAFKVVENKIKQSQGRKQQNASRESFEMKSKRVHYIEDTMCVKECIISNL